MQQPTISYDASRDLGIVRYPNGIEQEIQFQNGPIGDNGVNGIQNEDLLNLLAVRLRVLSSRFPCRENDIALMGIESARMWLEERTRLRREQGVEGKNIAHQSDHAIQTERCVQPECIGYGLTKEMHGLALDEQRRQGRLSPVVHD